MSSCDQCPRPGACCVAFPLSLPLPRAYAEAKQRWEDWQAANNSSWPFELLRPLEDSAQREWRQHLGAGDEVIWRFTCPKLGADGRCTIYAERPQPCRDFEPLSDSLCVLYKRPARSDDHAPALARRADSREEEKESDADILTRAPAIEEGRDART